MKRILVICGAGVATATVVASKVKDHLEATGQEALVSQAKVSDIVAADPAADVVVSTSPLPDELGVPVVRALPLIIGHGEEEVFAQLDAALAE
ncbi:PTS sugar transporter subunit IIB [Dermabacteraceae bacterium P13115]|nr:PTS sugar transporter subunit IIB [Dermabacteraceae bacterium TAE3-ERU5]